MEKAKEGVERAKEGVKRAKEGVERAEEAASGPTLFRRHQSRRNNAN